MDNGQTLTATDGHPFKTLDGWRDAVLLKKGGKLLLGGGEEDSASPLAQLRYATIADVRIEQERITTYNLEVAQQRKVPTAVLSHFAKINRVERIMQPYLEAVTRLAPASECRSRPDGSLE